MHLNIRINGFPCGHYTFILLLMLCVSTGVHAETDIDHGSFESVSNGFSHFYTFISPFVHKVVTSSALADMSQILWKFFAVMLIIWEVSLFSLRGIDFSDLFKVIFLIAVTHVLMNQYDEMTSALWSWSEAFASSIQVAAIGIDDQFYAPRFIWNLVTSLSWVDVGGMLIHPVNVVLMVGLAILSYLLSALAFITSVWGLWGYSLSKIIGLMFIPMILFERLSWLFDGWLRLFFGFLMYNVLSKAALMLVIIAVSAYCGISPTAIPNGMGHQFTTHSYMELLSLFIFVLLSIMGLICTGRFVATLVGGSQVCLHTSIANGASKLAGILK